MPFNIPPINTVERSASCCRNCKMYEEQHVNNKCLFQATIFQGMTPEEYAAHVTSDVQKIGWAGQYYK